MTTSARYQLVQTVLGGGTTSATQVVDIANTRPKSLLIVSTVSSTRAETLNGVVDTAGNLWLTSRSAVATTTAVRTRWQVRSEPTNQLTVTFSGAVGTKSVYFREYAAVDAYDQDITATGSSTSVASGSLTPKQADTLCITTTAYASSASTALAAGSGWGNFASNAVTATLVHGIEDKVLQAVAATDGTMTGSGGASPDFGCIQILFSLRTGLISGGSQFVVPDGLARSNLNP